MWLTTVREINIVIVSPEKQAYYLLLLPLIGPVMLLLFSSPLTQM